MAEKIIIAELEINTKKLIEESAEVAKRISVLKEQQKKLQKETSNLTTATDKQSQQFVENASNMKALTQSYNTNLKVLAESKQAIDDQEASIELLNLALEKEVASINEAREQNKLLTKVRNELNVSTAEGQIQLALLNNKLNENNDFVKENGDAMLKQKMNIGNYTQGMREAILQINPLNGGIFVFIQRSKEAGGAGNLFKNSLSGLTKGFIGLTKACLTFIFTPIGAIFSAIGLVLSVLINYLRSTQDGMDKITAVTRPLQAIFQSLIGVLQNVGKYLLDAFTNPKKSLTDLYEFVKQNLINRFTAFGKILEGIINLDFKTLRNGVAQAATGIENLEDKIKQGAKDTANFFKEAAKKGAEIDRITKEIEKAEISLNKERAISESKEKDLLLIARDTSKNLTEREAAAKEIIKIKKEEAAKEENILRLKIKRLNIEQSLNDTSREGNKELADLEAELERSLNRGKDAEIEQIRILSSARKEAQDKRIEQMNEELSLFVAKNRSKKKTLEESLKYEKEISKRRLEILKQEFNSSKISKRKYEEQKLLIGYEGTKKQAQIGVDALGQELKLWELQNKSKLENDKRLTDELVADEITRQEAIFTQKDQILEQQRQNDLISEKEYQTQKLQLVDEYESRKKAIEDTYIEQKKTDQNERISLEFEEKLIRLEKEGASEFALKLAQEEQQYRNQLAALEQRRLQGLILEENYQIALKNINQKYAQTKTNIAIAAENMRLQGVVQVAQGISQILGEQTALGKAAAIAGATIDTYRAANLALSTIPPPFGSIQAGISIATGLANVAKISGVEGVDNAISGLNSVSSGLGDIQVGQLPKAEKGALFKIGGKRHKQGGTKFIGEDGTAFEAEKGELIGVMNRNAARMFMDFNNKYRDGGIVSRGNIFSSGGFVQRENVLGKVVGIDYDLLAAKVGEANLKLPAPKVYAAVTDINDGQSNYAAVVAGANI